MCGEAIVADCWVIDEAALYHVPAHEALRAAEDEQGEEFKPIARRYCAAEGEPEEGEGESEAKEAPEEAVEPFPEEDLFEVAQIHPEMFLFKFR